VFQRFFEAAEIAKFNKQERLEYEDTLKAYRDWYSVMETAEKKGEAKGRAEGRVEGRAEGRAEGEAQKTIEIARNLKACGVDVATIAQTTGLSKEDISAL
ncbi:MAG: hypothetical protein IKT30_09560, partial [Bacteroidaceae bacterium]|nr:hypothetical protein [Bacteroidaceae bacterium]